MRAIQIEEPNRNSRIYYVRIMALTSLSIQEINSLMSEHFIKVFGNIVEHCPAAAIGILKYRPFNSTQDICTAVCKYLDGLNVNEKRNILCFHQDFVSQLTQFSRLLLADRPNDKIRINNGFSMDSLTISDKRRLNTLNDRYKEKFGFPFVMFGKRSIDGIFGEMERRMENDTDTEVERAIQEVKKISRVRIHEIVNKT